MARNEPMGTARIISIATIAFAIQLATISTAAVVYAESTYAKKTYLQTIVAEFARDRINILNMTTATIKARGGEALPEHEAELKYWEDKLKGLRDNGVR